uniref:MMPL family transporter n=1 Tax=Pontiella sp. TaxID=2837462 RepID=UPI003563EFAF
MKRLKMTSFSIRFPWIIMAVAVAVTVFFGTQFPKVSFDNDPENMLAEDEYIRVFHNEVKARYNLYDFVIVGIVNETNPDGIFNVETLGKIDSLTRELISLHRNADGKPEVMRDGQPYAPALESDSAWERGLAKVFGNDVNRLFAEDGSSAIIAPEIISPSVVDNIKQADRGQLAIQYLMEEAPATREQALAIKHDAMNNPLYKGTLVSEDGKAIALYIPIQEKTYSYNVANLIETLTAGWGDADQVYVTGQPVAQDTFGVEMLVQMASSAPLAGLAIFLLLLFFFRRLSLIIAPMLVAVISVVATMGLLIGLGFDVHIMSSMIAIFLMPISVADSVHILSEFFDSYHKFRDKAETIKHVVGHLFMPMLYTSLTTIAGFASLATTPIPPVRVFGLHVAFGVALA